jgi:hypothetical protein
LCERSAARDAVQAPAATATFNPNGGTLGWSVASFGLAGKFN